MGRSSGVDSNIQPSVMNGMNRARDQHRISLLQGLLHSIKTGPYRTPCGHVSWWLVTLSCVTFLWLPMGKQRSGPSHSPRGYHWVGGSLWCICGAVRVVAITMEVLHGNCSVGWCNQFYNFPQWLRLNLSTKETQPRGWNVIAKNWLSKQSLRALLIPVLILNRPHAPDKSHYKSKLIERNCLPWHEYFISNISHSLGLQHNGPRP